MGRFPKILFILLTFPLFAQNPATDRQQGLVTGEPFWRQALGGAVTALPSVQAQSAVVTLDGGNIRAYSTAGTPLWNYFAGGRLSPFVTRSREGTSYISRTNGALIAVNRSGRELWRIYPGAQLSGHIITGWDGRLFVPAGNRLFCYTASGNLLWSKTFEEAIALSPILDQGGGIILSLLNNDVMRINPYGETRTWKRSLKPVVLLSLGSGALVSPAPDAGAQGTGAPRVLAVYENGVMEILSEIDEWFLSAQSNAGPQMLPRLPAAPLAGASRGNNAAFATVDGRVHLISANEGKLLWTGDSHIRITGERADDAAMLYDERGIYILSRGGATGFTQDGRRLWYTLLENAAAIPAFGDDGVLYSGGRDWILYTYKLEDRVLQGKQSLYGPIPEGDYGTGNPPRRLLAEAPLLFNDSEVRARLESIGNAVRAGRVGASELAWTAWLMETAGFKPTEEFGPAQEIRNRVTAIRMLGYIGSRETIPWLVNLFRRESDPAVKSAAAAAIGDIGADPEGIAMRAFLDTVTFSSVSQDEQTLIAVAAATGALCRFSGPPLSDTGVRILTLLSVSTQPPLVRRQAGAELASLRVR